MIIGIIDYKKLFGKSFMIIKDIYIKGELIEYE